METTQPTATPTLTPGDVEHGNVLRITGTNITGSVTATYPWGFNANWSDGRESVERYPVIGVEFFNPS